MMRLHAWMAAMVLAMTASMPGEVRVPDRDLQSARPDEFLQSGGLAPERVAVEQPDRGQQSATGSTLYGCSRRCVRHADEHRQPNGRPRHEPAGTIRLPNDLL